MTPPDDPKKPRPVAKPLPRPGTQNEDRDRRREYHTPVHGIPVTTFAMPPMPAEQAPESWDSGRDAYTPVHEPPPHPTPAQQLTAIDTNVRKAAGASISTLGLLEELRRSNGQLQKMLAEVIEEKRRAQAVIEQMALGNHGSSMKDADLRRTISMKQGLAWAALLTAVASAITYLVMKGGF